MAPKVSKEMKTVVARLKGRFSKSQAIKMLGFRLVSAKPGHSVVCMDSRSRHKQHFGFIHGGILAALADTAAAIAAFTTVPKDTQLATIELKINYLEPVPGGRIEAHGHVLRSGRNFIVTECEIFDEKGNLAAKALLTFGAAGGHSLRPPAL